MNLNISELEEKMVVGIKPQPKEYQQPALRKQLITTSAKSEKKKVSYDDILSSLQMKVVDGKLQFMRADDEALESLKNLKETQTESINKKVVSFHQQSPNFYANPPPPIKMAQKTLKTRHLPIPQEEYQQPIMQRPLTKQEAIMRLLEARQEAARINQIKSTKLQFSTQNINIAPTMTPKIGNMFFKFK